MDYYANKQNQNVGPRAGEIRNESQKSQSVVKLGSWILVVRVSLICRMQGGSFREVLSVRCSRLSAPREERPGKTGSNIGAEVSQGRIKQINRESKWIELIGSGIEQGTKAIAAPDKGLKQRKV